MYNRKTPGQSRAGISLFVRGQDFDVRAYRSVKSEMMGDGRSVCFRSSSSQGIKFSLGLRLLVTTLLLVVCGVTIGGAFHFHTVNSMAEGSTETSKKGCGKFGFYLESRHNYKLNQEIWKAVSGNDAEILQDVVRQELKPGAHSWQLALKYHQTHNLHHNYSTMDEAVAQEIALDFFSSALVSCCLRNVTITSGMVKRAYSQIKLWSNYVNGSARVKDAVEVVKNFLYKNYNVTDSIDEEEIPKKPYDSEIARCRYLDERVMRNFSDIINREVPEGEILEKDFLMDLIRYFNVTSSAEARNVWLNVLPSLFKYTEVGKWLSEVYYHKKLVVDFHVIAEAELGKGKGNGTSTSEEYVVSDEVAINHDNDKYFAFQVIAYTLKWYYKDEGLFV